MKDDRIMSSTKTVEPFDLIETSLPVHVRSNGHEHSAVLVAVGTSTFSVEFAQLPPLRLNEKVEVKWRGEWRQTSIREFQATPTGAICQFGFGGQASSLSSAITNLKTGEAAVKFLFVDDDPDQLKLLAELSKPVTKSCERVTLHAISDPVKAVECLDRESIDVLVTDLEMPSINGIDLLKLAKKRNAHTQVIFLTANSTHEALLEAMELGASDYLIKPIRQESLLSLLDQALERKHRWFKSLAQTWKN